MGFGFDLIVFDIAPAVKDLLEPDESIINPFYMRQLLEYGIKLGSSQSTDMNPESLLRDAEVFLFSLSYLWWDYVYLFFDI